MYLAYRLTQYFKCELVICVLKSERMSHKNLCMVFLENVDYLATPGLPSHVVPVGWNSFASLHGACILQVTTSLLCPSLSITLRLSDWSYVAPSPEPSSFICIICLASTEIWAVIPALSHAVSFGYHLALPLLPTRADLEILVQSWCTCSTRHLPVCQPEGAQSWDYLGSPVSFSFLKYP